MSHKTAYYIAEPVLSRELEAVTAFAPDQVVVATYPTGDFHLDRMIEFWTLMKTPTRDNENGPGHLGTLSWIYSHREIFKKDGLYQLYAFLYKPTGELIAVGGVVDEDRGVLRDKNLTANGLWGYFNVDYRLRGKGLGKIITSYTDGQVHAYADKIGAPVIMYLFTGEASAMHIYEGLGWTPAGEDVTVGDFAGVEGLPDQEKLYRKIYFAGDGTAKTRQQLESLSD
jgi:GNAT superfamily N-acetyltransferase